MAAAALTATFLAQLRGADGGDRDVKVTWSVPAPKDSVQIVTLTQNTTTPISIPAGTTLIVVIPPTNNTQAIRVDDASGKKIGQAIPTIIPAEGDTTLTLHLAAGSNQTVTVISL
jgi:hypothetical protein